MRIMISLLAALAAVVHPAPAAEPRSHPPNIILIVADDLGEAKNLAKTNRAKADELHAKLVAWREAVRAPMPRPKPVE
jgi:hypothetical protein